MARHAGIIFGILLMVIIFGTPLIGIGTGACMGYYPGVIDKLRSCHKAGEMLGDDIGVSYYGLSCGFAKSEGGYGRVTWKLPVSGSEGRGTFSFYLERHGAGWKMLQGSLEAGERELNVIRCSYVKRDTFRGVR